MPNKSRRPGLLGLWRGRKALAIALSVALVGLMGATATQAADTRDSFTAKLNNTTAGTGTCPDMSPGTMGWHFVAPSNMGKELKFDSFNGQFMLKGKTLTVTDFDYKVEGKDKYDQIFVYTPIGATLQSSTTAVISGLDLDKTVKFNLSHICPGVEDKSSDLTVFKYDEQGENLLSGATFVLSLKGKTVATLTDGANGDVADGKVTFKDLAYGDYVVTETVAPKYFALDTDTTRDVKVDTAKEEAKFYNKRLTTDVVIEKRDSAGEKPLLGGATFLIVGDGVSKTIKDDSADDADKTPGIIKLVGVPQGFEYTVTETKSPEGYTRVTESMKKLLPSETPFVFFNTKNEGGGELEEIVVRKVIDGTTTLLPGATFKITGPGLPEGGVTIVDGKGSDTKSDGLFTFGDLEVGSSYVITEVKAPEGYRLLTSPVTHKVIAGDNTLTFKNEKLEGGQERGMVTVHKYIEGTEDHLGGATFTLVADQKPGETMTITDGGTGDLDGKADGIIVFENVQFGWKWTLSEVSAPPFYVKSEKTYTVQLTGENPDDMFKYYNKRAMADLTLFKRVTSTNALLGGATFTITGGTLTSPLVVADNGANDADTDAGEFLVKGLAAGYEYTVTESVVPAGYTGAAAQKITLPTAGGSLTFLNALETGGGQTPLAAIVVKKYVKGTTTLLPGATFKITGPGLPTAGLTVVDGQGGDALDGMFTFANLLVGSEYTVTESAAPQYYKLLTATKTHTVVLGENVLSFENERLTGTITVVKEATGTDTKLAGSSFKFWRDGAAASAVTVADNGANDADNRVGYVALAGLEFGYKYLVQEVKAPAGYKLNGTVFVVSNLDNAMVTFTVDNDKLPVEGGAVVPGGTGVLPGTGAGMAQEIAIGAGLLLLLGSVMLVAARGRRFN